MNLNNLSRREFFLLSTATFASFNVESSYISRDDINSGLVNELLYIYKFWQNTTSILPINYINRKMTENRATQFSQLVQDDFKNNNVLIIDGLILSKTEVAVLADMGRQLYSTQNLS